VDDDVFVALTHQSGVRSHLWMSSMAAQPGPRMRLLGTRAAYTKYGLDIQEETLKTGARPDQPDWGRESEHDWGTLGAGTQVQQVMTEAGNYPAFYAGVYRALREGAAPPVDPQQALEVLSVIDAAQRSATERCLVVL
jgi:predicted dehydrogenase